MIPYPAHPHAARVRHHVQRVADDLRRLRAAGFRQPERLPAAVADAVLNLGEDLGALMSIEIREQLPEVQKYLRRVKRERGPR